MRIFYLVVFLSFLFFTSAFSSENMPCSYADDFEGNAVYNYGYENLTAASEACTGSGCTACGTATGEPFYQRCYRLESGGQTQYYVVCRDCEPSPDDPAVCDPDDPGDPDPDPDPDPDDPGNGGPGDPQDPGSPGSPDGPDSPDPIPDEILIGDCIISLVEFKQWLGSPDAFPFNFVYSLYEVLSPLFALSPGVPNLSFSFGGSGFETGDISITPYLEPLDPYVRFMRNCVGFALVFSFVTYGLKRYRNLNGIGGD